jgi:hypothetical protein
VYTTDKHDNPFDDGFFLLEKFAKKEIKNSKHEAILISMTRCKKN